MPSVQPNPDRIFFASLAAFALALVLVGFAPTFFLKTALDAPDLKPLVHVHGVLFTAWQGLFLVQALLIGRGKFALHRTLGFLAVALATAMFVTGFMVVLGKPRLTIETRAFIFSPLLSLLLFALFVASAIRFRRNAAAHKRLILLASTIFVGAAIRRVYHLLGLAPTELVLQVTGFVLLLLPLVVHDLVRMKRLHPVTMVGIGIALLRYPLHQAVAFTAEWQRFAAHVTSP